jgi:DNA ligase-associated metallophosphoesterase
MSSSTASSTWSSTLSSTSSSTLCIELHGEQLLLHADKALIWPRRRTLLVADVHLGKSDVLRRHGVAVPSGSTDRDLQRLGDLIRAHAIERLVVLGDLVHSRLPDRAPWLEQLAAFRRAHSQLSMELIGGNHDRHLRASDLQFHDLGERAVEAPFVYLHAVQPDLDGYTLGGHIHPVTVLHSKPRKLRVPVFWRQEFGMTLPAFGALTGGWAVQASAPEKMYACAGQVLELRLPAGGPPARRAKLAAKPPAE